MALILEEEDAMFTGDNVLGQGTTVFEDLSTYLNSLEKMKGMFSGRAYPGHGPVIDDGRTKIMEYIQHRQQREQQVIEVLSSPRPSDEGSEENDLGDWDSMEIVKIIYKDVPESLYIPAHGGVMQVLRKLQQEDKVATDSSTKRWRINSRAAL
jgi:endoribonuclease LACTB2